MWGLVTNAVGAAKAATAVVGNVKSIAVSYLYPTMPINGDERPNSRPNTPSPVDGLFSAQVPTEEFSEDQKRVQEALTFLKTAHYSKFQKTRFQGIIDDLNIILNDICKLQEQEKSKFKETGQLICLSELHINLQIQELHSKYKFRTLGDTENQLRTYLTKFSRNQSLECKTTAPIIDASKKELLDKATEKFAFAFSHYFFKRTSKICDDPSFFEKEYYKINIFIQLIKEDLGLQSKEDIIEKIVDSFASFPLAGKSALREAFQFLRSFILMSIGSEEVDKLEDKIESIRTLVTDRVRSNSIKISDDDKIIPYDISTPTSRKRHRKLIPRMPEIKDQAENWQAPGIRQEDFKNPEQAFAFIQQIVALDQEFDNENLVKFACAIQNNLFIPDNNEAITLFLQLIREGKIKDSHAIYRFVVAITSTETKGNISYFHQVFAELICNRKVMIPIVHEVFSKAISDNMVSDQNAICFFAKSILLGIVSRESAKNFISYFLEQYRSGKNIISIDTSSGEYLSNLFLKYTSSDETVCDESVCDESDFVPSPASGRNSRASSIASTQSATSSVPSFRSVTPVPELEVEPTRAPEAPEEVEETDADKAWRLGTEPEGSVFNVIEYEDFSIAIENGTITDWNVIKTFSKAFFDKQTIFKTNPSLTFRFLSFLIKKIDAKEEWDETQKIVLKKKATDTLKNCLIDFSRNIDSETHFEALENFVKLLANEITFPIREAYLSFIEKIESGDISSVNIIAQFSEVFLSDELKNPIACNSSVINKLIESIVAIRLNHASTSMPQDTILAYINLENKLTKKNLSLKHDKKVYRDSVDLLRRIGNERNGRIKNQLKENLQNARAVENDADARRSSIESAEDLSVQLNFDYINFTAALNPPPAPKKTRWQRTKEFFSNLLPSFRRARA